MHFRTKIELGYTVGFLNFIPMVLILDQWFLLVNGRFDAITVRGWFGFAVVLGVGWWSTNLILKGFDERDRERERDRKPL